MFTGIIESLGKIVTTERVGSNLELWVSCDFTNELKVDQSLAHNGICLTVVEIALDGRKSG
jgi:riboflavin synthase